MLKIKVSAAEFIPLQKHLDLLGNVNSYIYAVMKVRNDGTLPGIYVHYLCL